MALFTFNYHRAHRKCALGILHIDSGCSSTWSLPLFKQTVWNSMAMAVYLQSFPPTTGSAATALQAVGSVVVKDGIEHGTPARITGIYMEAYSPEPHIEGPEHQRVPLLQPELLLNGPDRPIRSDGLPIPYYSCANTLDFSSIFLRMDQP